MLRLLLMLALAYAGLAAFAVLTADRQIFLPPAPSYTERDLPLLRIPTPDGGSVAGLHLPSTENAVTLLVSHGNAEDLGTLAPFLAEMRDAGFGVLAYDYRGYGLSSGPRATEASSYRDVEAVYRYAVETLAIPPRRIVLYGRSVGAGPAIHLAVSAPVGGLVVESGFTSAFVVITRVPILPFDKFTNLRKIRKVRCPVLVIHGAADEIIPPSHARALFAAAPEPKRLAIVPDAGHNDLAWVAGEGYWETLREFAAMVE
ncbi:MAG TPA: alpha/beta hydrolase [Thermoanaerobaculia bacterium]|nr:alpha/beta hydrolase [Thermoanaerobaculia bacterium]